MGIFESVRKVFRRRRKESPASTLTLMRDTMPNGLSFSQGNTITFSGQVQSQPVVSGWSQPVVIRHPVHMLVEEIAAQIDEKGLSDYEFRDWLRDNLSRCEYQSEGGMRQYVKPDDIKPISVIDTMLEVK